MVHDSIQPQLVESFNRNLLTRISCSDVQLPPAWEPPEHLRTDRCLTEAAFTTGNPILMLSPDPQGYIKKPDIFVVTFWHCIHVKTMQTASVLGSLSVDVSGAKLISDQILVHKPRSLCSFTLSKHT